MIKLLIKRTLLAFISFLTRRQAVLLPKESFDEQSIFDLLAPYRVGGTLEIQLFEQRKGQLTLTLLGYEGSFPTRTLWTSQVINYLGPCSMIFNLCAGQVILGDRKIGIAPSPSRRFCWRFQYRSDEGFSRERLTGHYLPGDGTVIDSEYFCGGTYIDHEAQSLGEHESVLRLMRQYDANGPVLEVGCATGGFLAVMATEGIECFGLDISEWAVTQARAKVGMDRAWVCDVEKGNIPDEVAMKAPFGTLVLWAVLEHFSEPFIVLANLTKIAIPGSKIIINTTNSNSLMHTLFGQQWEGYFDPTHFGVNRINVDALRHELKQLGWKVEKLTTHLIWDGNADPTCATLRDWWSADARFRKLVSERDLGDLITCVAIKE